MPTTKRINYHQHNYLLAKPNKATRKKNVKIKDFTDVMLHCNIPKQKRQVIVEHYLKIVRAAVLNGNCFTLPSNAGDIVIVRKLAGYKIPPFSIGAMKLTGKPQRALVPHRQGREYNIKIKGGWIEKLDYHFSAARIFRSLLFKILAKTYKEYPYGDQ